MADLSTDAGAAIRRVDWISCTNLKNQIVHFVEIVVEDPFILNRFFGPNDSRGFRPTPPPALVDAQMFQRGSQHFPILQGDTFHLRNQDIRLLDHLLAKLL